MDPARAEEDYVRLIQEWELSRQAVAAAALDDTFISERWGEMSLRWIYGHMIEEYARHADLLRERVDGVTGAWNLRVTNRPSVTRSGRPR